MKITKQRLNQIIKEEIERETKGNDNSAITALLATQAILGFAEVAEEELPLQESEVELSLGTIFQMLVSVVGIAGLTGMGQWAIMSYFGRKNTKHIEQITSDISNTLRDGIPEEFDPEELEAVLGDPEIYDAAEEYLSEISEVRFKDEMIMKVSGKSKLDALEDQDLVEILKVSAEFQRSALDAYQRKIIKVLYDHGLIEKYLPFTQIEEITKMLSGKVIQAGSRETLNLLAGRSVLDPDIGKN